MSTKDEVEQAMQECVEKGWVKVVDYDREGNALYRITPKGSRYVESMPHDDGGEGDS